MAKSQDLTELAELVNPIGTAFEAGEREVIYSGKHASEIAAYFLDIGCSIEIKGEDYISIRRQ